MVCFLYGFKDDWYFFNYKELFSINFLIEVFGVVINVFIYYNKNILFLC